MIKAVCIIVSKPLSERGLNIGFDRVKRTFVSEPEMTSKWGANLFQTSVIRDDQAIGFI
ncbi:hypothetical protein RB2083_2936 [Rhodobacteraceae bacterium HTCC2083]|nr:hypothetical protein RB2083_2936 [Rhodobacteraceae bacterium HTCC2083]